MQALDIIQAEHRGMWRVASAMDSLAGLMAAPQPQTDTNASPFDCATTLVRLLDYIDGYVDQVHHPKEDQHLFAALRLRDPASLVTIDRLEHEHRDSPRYLAELRQSLQALLSAEGGPAAATVPDLAALAQRVQTFAEHLRAHMRLEESTVMPAARQALTASDWQAINHAFADNDDPLFGQQARDEWAALKARIVALAPEPVGLGGQGNPSAFPWAPHTTAPAPSDTPAGEVVLDIRGLTSHYGRIQALHGIDLQVRAGQLVALVGANGAGKTTLLRTISGVQPLSGGSIQLFGRDIARLPPEQRVRLGIGHVPEGRQVFGPMSIADNLRLGAYTRRDGEIAADLARMYALFPILHEKRELPAGTLSGGQQQMLAMARALMGCPQLLLLDEPSMGLAPLLVEEIFRVIKRLKAEGTTIFLVEQNAHAALSIADIGYVIETGHTVLTGPGPELLRNDRVRAAYLGL